METNEKLAQLESEIKVLKNEIQAVLLDLRDKYLESENPFNAPAQAATAQQIVIDRAPAASEPPRRAEAPPAPAPVAVAEEEAPAEAPAEAAAEPVAEPEMMGEPSFEEAPVEVKPMPLPDSAPQSQQRGQCHSGLAADISLVTITGLATWADDCVRRLGRQRTESLLDVAEMLGLLSPDLKGIVTKLIQVEGDDHTAVLPARDYLNALVRITSLLGKDNQQEQALLAVIGGEDEHR